MEWTLPLTEFIAGKLSDILSEYIFDISMSITHRTKKVTQMSKSKITPKNSPP